MNMNDVAHRRRKRPFFWLLLAGGLLGGLLLGSWVVLAQESSESGTAVDGLASTAISYQGQLADNDGNPLNGSYTIRFRLYADLNGGSQVGSDLIKTVTVTDGYFATELDFGTDAFVGSARYLDIAVRPGTSGAFTPLAPRVPLNTVPYAAGLIPGARLTANQNSSLLALSNTRSTAASGATALSAKTNAPGSHAIIAEANATGGGGAGIWGSSNSPDGFGGYFTNSSVGGMGAGLFAQSANNDAPDIVLGGGSWGVLATDPATEMNLHLVSSKHVVVRLDDNGGQNGQFYVRGSNNQTLFQLGEEGLMTLFTADGDESILLNSQSSAQIQLKNAAGQVAVQIDADVNGAGRVTTGVLEITGGADLAEPFNIRPAGQGEAPQPGEVVCIDPAHPGDLVVCDAAYERTVAGVISGAGGVNPGLVMHQPGTLASGQLPVALTGRVYVWARGPIVPGDLLTTSEMPGVAMVAVDNGRSSGAILGKAMTPLDSETGLVLLLISLQ